MKCKKCGTENNAGAKFCIKCGARLEGGDVSPEIDIGKEIKSFDKEFAEIEKSLDRELSSVTGDKEVSPEKPPLEGSVKEKHALGKISPEAKKYLRAIFPKAAGLSLKRMKTTLSEMQIEEIAELNITPAQLDQLVISAVEEVPCETVGVIFGKKQIDGLHIGKTYVIQNVYDRDAISVSPRYFSTELIHEYEKSVSDLEFFGGYHSHPYFSDIIGGVSYAGSRLSGGDLKAIFQHNEVFPDMQAVVELCLAYFPHELWNFNGYSDSDWHEVVFESPGFGIAGLDPNEEGPDYPVKHFPAKRYNVLEKDVDVSVPKDLVLEKLHETISKYLREGNRDAARKVDEDIKALNAIEGDNLQGFRVILAAHMIDCDLLSKKGIFLLKTIPIRISSELEIM